MHFCALYYYLIFHACFLEKYVWEDEKDMLTPKQPPSTFFSYTCSCTSLKAISHSALISYVSAMNPNLFVFLLCAQH